MVHTVPQTRHAAYKLAKLANEQIQNVCKAKFDHLYTAMDFTPREPVKQKPLRLRGADWGDFDLARLFVVWKEGEICAAIDMAEDLPSSCLHYLGGGVDRSRLPPIIIDPRRQPLTED